MRGLHLTRNPEGKRFVRAPGGGIRLYFEGPAGSEIFEDAWFAIFVDPCRRQFDKKNHFSYSWGPCGQQHGLIWLHLSIKSMLSSYPKAKVKTQGPGRAYYFRI